MYCSVFLYTFVKVYPMFIEIYTFEVGKEGEPDIRT